MDFTKDEWFPSRLAFGKFKGRRYQESREDGELRSWLEWLAESTNGRSSAMGRWDLGQLENGTVLEDAAFLDLEIQEHTGDVAAGMVVFQQPEIALYQRLVEAARNRLAELEYGIEKSKVAPIISQPELWIAAITRAAGGILVTHNSDDRHSILIPATWMIPRNGSLPAEVSTAPPSGIALCRATSRNGNVPARRLDRPGNALRQKQPPRNDVPVPCINDDFGRLVQQVAFGDVEFHKDGLLVPKYRCHRNNAKAGGSSSGP